MSNDCKCCSTVELGIDNVLAALKEYRLDLLYDWDYESAHVYNDNIERYRCRWWASIWQSIKSFKRVDVTRTTEQCMQAFLNDVDEWAYWEWARMRAIDVKYTQLVEQINQLVSLCDLGVKEGNRTIFVDSNIANKFAKYYMAS